MLTHQSIQMANTPLTLLNQGHETSLRYKQLVAAYLGIPTGKRLTCLLRVRENVEATIAQWAPDSIFGKRITEE